MLNWQKKGLVYHSSGSQEWSRSHTQLPIVDASREGRWRIYFATRDALGRSNISYIEVEAGHPANILYKHDRTLLPLGGLGAFDESGIMPLSLVVHEGRHYLYYAGWSLKVTVPYQNSIGLAVSDDCGETWVKQGEGPLFGTLLHEPHFTGTAYVAVEG
ncbi:MAG TPA: hypothetical protein VGR19_00545, partial [Allosphingosinicella sp.]|nr:hypothetical protein [Allosphingosinicella sp.]